MARFPRLGRRLAAAISFGLASANPPGDIQAQVPTQAEPQPYELGSQGGDQPAPSVTLDCKEGCGVEGSGGDEKCVEGSCGDATMLPAAKGSDALDGKPPREDDYARYFYEYVNLYHQMDMLEDTHRTGSYFNAIMWNLGSFQDKVVLDVGAGTGILSIFAARAGARHVFAVEATELAERSRRIVEANGLSSVITVLQGTVETVTLPYKVDVIVSEWMGYFLLRESMLDSVLTARDKHLIEGGVMFPSHATLYLAPLGAVKTLRDKWESWEAERDHWVSFQRDMVDLYETDFSSVEEDFMKEQRRYYLQTGSMDSLTPNDLSGPAMPLLELDLLTATVEELLAPSQPLRCSMSISRGGPIEGFTGFFRAYFRGSPGSLLDQEVTLATGPTADGSSTHWGQQVFGFYPPLEAERGDTLEVSMFIRRQERNPRLLRMDSKFKLYGHDGSVIEEREETYFMD